MGDPDPENNADGEAAAVGGEAAAENQHTGLNLNQAKARDSFSDQINKAEAVLALKGVESQWSYESFNNFVEVLRKADPKSRTFAHLKLKADKFDPKRSSVMAAINASERV